MVEFENFKWCFICEKMDMMKNVVKDIMIVFLLVLDDFDRACKVVDENDKGDLFVEGIGLVYKKFYNILEQKGFKFMEINGEDFDLELYEVLMEVFVFLEEQKGKIIDIVEKGYWFNDKIICYVKVVVGK